MAITALIFSILAIIISVLTFVFRKPGNDGLDGAKGDKGDIPVFKIVDGKLYVAYLDSVTKMYVSDWVDLGSIGDSKCDELNGSHIESLLKKLERLELTNTIIVAKDFYVNQD